MLRRTIKEAKNLTFVVIYTREPHARQMAFKEIAQPTSWDERRALAEKTKKELKLDALFLIDDMGDPSRKLLGDVPNPAIFVEKDGTIHDKLAWADASEIRGIIKDWHPLPPKETPGPPVKPDEKKDKDQVNGEVATKSDGQCGAWMVRIDR